MNGFGKDLKNKIINTKLYRKTTVNSLLSFESGELCFSTENSVSLINQGEIAIVLEKDNYNGNFVDGDADAGRNYGYDEFRLEMSRKELIGKKTCFFLFFELSLY